MNIAPLCTVPPFLGGSPCPNHPEPFEPWPLPAQDDVQLPVEPVDVEVAARLLRLGT